eukprot:CAMPEP_0172600194 /NCGR_PEP_ID=MMETSP1068-20121228/20339_1 /TAXON_ID=35684 /ORGANISM="Pseudopedinella elastica, Strain CCMP716" /LENGTH=408 /DNA_ID=CAMNT_0013400741 /DNA_START=113 /DNA_END=1339 /DNA_ORIENTATION=+
MTDGNFPTTVDFNEVDDTVLEYLLFRGFTRSFRSVAADSRSDRTRGFDADKVAVELVELVEDNDLEGYSGLWAFLEARFFSHLDASLTVTVTDLRARLDKLFLVQAIKAGRRDAVHAFFQTYGPELHRRAQQQAGGTKTAEAARGPDRGEGGSEAAGGWAPWFALAYLTDPAADAAFAPFFNPNWAAQVHLALGNFLGLIFRSAPLPKLLMLERWQRSETQRNLRRDMATLVGHGETLERRARNAENEVAWLLGSVRDLAEAVHKLATMPGAPDRAKQSPRQSAERGGLFSDAAGGREGGSGGQASRLARARLRGGRVLQLARKAAADARPPDSLLSGLAKAALPDGQDKPTTGGDDSSDLAKAALPGVQSSGAQTQQSSASDGPHASDVQSLAAEVAAWLSMLQEDD